MPLYFEGDIVIIPTNKEVGIVSFCFNGVAGVCSIVDDEFYEQTMLWGMSITKEILQLIPEFEMHTPFNRFSHQGDISHYSTNFNSRHSISVCFQGNKMMYVNVFGIKNKMIRNFHELQQIYYSIHREQLNVNKLIEHIKQSSLTIDIHYLK